MRKRDQAQLVSIENDHRITRTSDPEFWFLYQRAVLLALKEMGVLNDAQYWYAEQKLKKQCGCPEREKGV